jgi:hypothetical protein
MHSVWVIASWVFAIICFFGVLFAWSGWMSKRHTRRMNLEQELLRRKQKFNMRRFLSAIGPASTLTGLDRAEIRRLAMSGREQIKADTMAISARKRIELRQKRKQERPLPNGSRKMNPNKREIPL